MRSFASLNGFLPKPLISNCKKYGIQVGENLTPQDLCLRFNIEKNGDLFYKTWKGRTGYGRRLRLPKRGNCLGLTMAYTLLHMHDCLEQHYEATKFFYSLPKESFGSIEVEREVKQDPPGGVVTPDEDQKKCFFNYFSFVGKIQTCQDNSQRNSLTVFSYKIFPKCEKVALKFSSRYGTLTATALAEQLEEAVKQKEFRYFLIGFKCGKGGYRHIVCLSHEDREDCWRYYDSNAEMELIFDNLRVAIETIAPHLLRRVLKLTPNRNKDFSKAFTQWLLSLRVYGFKIPPKVKTKNEVLKGHSSFGRLQQVLNPNLYYEYILKNRSLLFSNLDDETKQDLDKYKSSIAPRESEPVSPYSLFKM